LLFPHCSLSAHFLRLRLQLVMSSRHLILASGALIGILSVGATPVAAERIPLIVSGKVLDEENDPIPRSFVQIWQTHPVSGLYDHPNSADPNNVDPAFQYYGTAAVEEDGSFEFVTYKPAPFTYRPPHIHFKVWLPAEEGAESKDNILTSQFYFREDGTRADDRLLLDLEEISDVDGNAALIVNKNIVIGSSDGSSGSATPSQAEGPFYPVVDFFDIGSDLTKVATDDVPDVVDVVDEPPTTISIGGGGGMKEEGEIVNIVAEDGAKTVGHASDKSASSLQESTSSSSPAAIASVLPLSMLLCIASNLLR